MVKITFILADGTRREVEGEEGQTIKDAALLASLPGIAAECGGVCACATCHVVVDPEWFEVVGSPPDFEDEMLTIVENRESGSRLGCQIEISPQMDGLTLRIP